MCLVTNHLHYNYYHTFRFFFLMLVCSLLLNQSNQCSIHRSYYFLIYTLYWVYPTSLNLYTNLHFDNIIKVSGYYIFLRIFQLDLANHHCFIFSCHFVIVIATIIIIAFCHFEPNFKVKAYFLDLLFLALVFRFLFSKILRFFILLKSALFIIAFLYASTLAVTFTTLVSTIILLYHQLFLSIENLFQIILLLYINIIYFLF